MPSWSPVSSPRSSDKIREVKGKPGKPDRADAVKQILEDLINEIAPNPTDPNASYMSIVEAKAKQKQIRNVFGEVEEHITREAILKGVRPDGRSFTDIRPISVEVGVLPRVHGSAVFSRGETQSMCTVTLGTCIRCADRRWHSAKNMPRNSCSITTSRATASAKCGPIRGPGRREDRSWCTGGALAAAGAAQRRAVPLYRSRHLRHSGIQWLILDGSVAAADVSP